MSAKRPGPAARRVLELLRSVDGAWVSGNRLLEAGGSRYGARIFELRHDYGLTIEKRSAPNGSPVPWYRLVNEQMRLDEVA